MLIHYYRLGKYRCRGNTAAESLTGDAAGAAADSPAAGRPAEEGWSPVRPTFRTWVDTAGPVQKQLLLDYEEDRLCVVRQVSRYGSIGGSRLWPSAEPENPDGRDSDECA
jgi:hypothetical protein